jgi:prepilin-type N-terminal cleavage/methylation domain-containing protein
MKQKKAFTLIELLVVVAIIALLISILLPSLSRARELSKRLVCAANVKGIGTSFKIYANDYEENYPTVPFLEPSGTTPTLIDYTLVETSLYPPAPYGAPNPGQPQPNRRTQSQKLSSTVLSNTRSFWMQVRSGDVTPKQFVCPSSGDGISNEQNTDLYYDFAGLKNISYGYQVPYGPFTTRASESTDPRQPVASDKGPYSQTGYAPNPVLPATHPAWTAGSGDTNPDAMSPQDWQGYNSGSHGGNGTGEGQNVLYGDGHATFEKKPIVGIDQDNIFTHMGNNWSSGYQNRMSGDSVAPAGTAKNYFPGYKTISNTSNGSTDTIIWP